MALPVRAGEKAAWKAGLARANITPRQRMWLAGYGGRDHPAEAKLHDLWIKELALEDARGHRVVLLTSDLCGMPKWYQTRISGRPSPSRSAWIGSPTRRPSATDPKSSSPRKTGSCTA
jgi:hypothetical protein